MITTRPQFFNRLTSKELLCVVKVGLKQEQRTKTGHFELSKNDVVYKVLYFRIKQITKKLQRHQSEKENWIHTI